MDNGTTGHCWMMMEKRSWLLLNPSLIVGFILIRVLSNSEKEKKNLWLHSRKRFIIESPLHRSVEAGGNSGEENTHL